MITKIILAGGTGLLGRILQNYFTEQGYEIVVLTRSPGEALGKVREVYWNGRDIGEWAGELEGAKALVNLSGRTVDCRYHARNRREIMQSRIDSTRVLGQALAQCQAPPEVWLNASTATIYRHNFGPAWDESGEIGAHPDAKDDFSIEVARAWEKEVEDVNTPETRKIILRTAMVMASGSNSVFPVLRRLVRLGLGGRMGNGRQYVSWIHELDFCRAIEWLIIHGNLSGIVNIAAPNPIPNAEMMHLMRQVCHRRFGLPAASWMLEVGAFLLRTETELIIKSRRVVPGKLMESGFQFRFPEFGSAVEELHSQLV